jgi:hypothetical protein
MDSVAIVLSFFLPMVKRSPRDEAPTMQARYHVAAGGAGLRKNGDAPQCDAIPPKWHEFIELVGCIAEKSPSFLSIGRDYAGGAK